GALLIVAVLYSVLGTKGNDRIVGYLGSGIEPNLQVPFIVTRAVRFGAMSKLATQQPIWPNELTDDSLSNDCVVASQRAEALLKSVTERLELWIRLLLDVVEGLMSIHSTGIVHRDIIMNNILIDEVEESIGTQRLRAKVADF